MKTDRLKPCDILLYKGKGFTSWLIQAGTGSKYDHVAVVANPQMNLAIESNTGRQSGVRAIDLRKLQAHSIDIYRVRPQFSFKPEQVISYLVSRLGAPYDWGGVIALGAMKALSFVTGFKKFTGFHQFQKNKDYFCSELVYEAFEKGGLDIVPQVSEADVTSPGDIAASDRVEKI